MLRKTGGLILCLFLLSIITASTGCARKTKPMSPAFPEAQGVSGQEMPEAQRGGPLGEGMGDEYAEGELPIPQTDLARDLVFEQAARELQTIYFDFDSSVLKADAKANLERGANWMKANPNVNVRVEGHCDERGTNEYNLALGERRALAARRYLVSLGVNSDRIFTISYGEEKPAVEGHDESAWKFNRRDEFKVSF
jgi:peptidoglycan-associated lipoprotein